MRQQKKQTGITVFYSYAEADRVWRDQLATHLSHLKREGLIEEWHDQQILAGADRIQQIDQAIHSASIILLLISSDFLASDTCYQMEMQQALERHRRGEARVVPVIVRPCDWQHSPFAHLQCLPHSTKAIITWDNQDEAFAAIAQGLRKLIVQYPSDSPQSNALRQNRVRLLKQVRKTWISGLLEQSLHQAVWIDLYLQDRPDALENPWRFQVQELNQRPRTLPIGTNIIDVYDDAEEKLLILGEPGSGKTTLLLQLAKALLGRAEADERQLIPVVFPLSSWRRKQKNLTPWLVEELVTKYHLPRRVAQHWIDTDQILPLLDGLDEVAKDLRIYCVQAIAAYSSRNPDQPDSPLVICCRSKDHYELSLSLPVQYAVQILPLTDEQIDTYFSSAGSQVEGLRHLLHTDAHFAELPRTPLMLDIFMLAFQGKRLFNFPSKDNFPSETNFPSASSEQILQVIFGAYVERMLSRRRQSQLWTKEQIRHWLIFLAKRMQRWQQTFLIKDLLRPDGLEGLQKHLYQWSSSLFIGLITGLMVGLYFGLLIGSRAGLFGGTLTGLCVGPLVRVASMLSKRSNMVIDMSGNRVYMLFIIELIVALLIGWLVWLCFGLLIGGFLVMLIGLFSVAWIYGISSVYDALLDYNSLPSSDTLINKFNPWLIMKINGMYGVVFFSLLSIMLVGLGIGLPTGLRLGLGTGLFFWLLGVLLPCIWVFIFRKFVQPFLVHFWLWYTNCLPWNFVSFLDEATERLLLRNLGSNSYIFMHRLLLEYLATLDESLFREHISLKSKRDKE